MCDEVKVKVCPQCRRPSKRFRRGVCESCRLHYLKYGTYIRSQPLRRTKWMQIAVCEDCKARPSQTGGVTGPYLCDRCDKYRKRTGRPRPRWRDRDTCRNPACHRPLNGPRMYGGYHEAKGYCTTCYSYLGEHGENRSAELVRRQAPHGWCQCGLPAVEVRQLSGVLVTDFNDPKEWDEPLCAECAALEDEPIW